jgi:predicted GNAT superfamily acetyltransferase
MTSTISIRRLETVSELKQVQDLEKSVWKDTPLPIHQTITAINNGGLVLGAFIKGKLVGFSYAFPGFLNGKVYLCSHMLGILQNYQGLGIGAAIKEAQKKAAIEQGYSLLTWTYDPLESINAFLNLSKLKAICSTYIENCYGDMEDELNNGLPSDRLKVEWWIKSPYLEKTQEWGQGELVKISYDTNMVGFPKLTDTDPSLFMKLETILVPIPKQFQQIKKNDFELALDWRLKTRRLLQTFFSNGYAAVSVLKQDTEPVHYYVLTKRKALSID